MNGTLLAYVDTMPVIRDLEKLQTAILDQDLQRRRARVDRILDELFQRMNWCNDDFSGGNLVHHVLMERADSAWRFQFFLGFPLHAAGIIAISVHYSGTPLTSLTDINTESDLSGGH